MYYSKNYINLKALEWGKKDELSLLIVNSQAVKITDSSSTDTKGFCPYKATNGIKRHLVIDVLGIPKCITCTLANKSDDCGLIEVIRDKSRLFSRVKLQDDNSS